VLVAHKGHILLKKGYGLANRECGDVPNRPQTKFRIASLTKGFTAMAIMQLEEKGLLQVEQPLSTFIADYPRGNEITIHHLLTHSSGVTNHTELAHYDERIRPYLWSTENLINEFKHYELESNPGERNSYCNAGYVLLTYIIEQVSGQSYENYLQQHILQPLGMNNTNVDFNRKLTTNRAAGYHMEKEFIQPEYANMSAMSGAAALYSTAEDLYLWDRALYTEVLVNKHTLDRMFTAYFPSYGGYGWDVTRIDRNGVSTRRIAHLGQVEGFFSFIARYVDEDLTVIVLSNTDMAAVEAINDNLARVALGEKVNVPYSPAAISIDREIGSFVGVYIHLEKADEKMVITASNGALYVSPYGFQTYPVFPVRVDGASIFFNAEHIDEQFEFMHNEANAVEKVIYRSANGDIATYACSPH
jgi:CubicO group peptidase (beta-lactamase class C family)